VAEAAADTDLRDEAGDSWTGAATLATMASFAKWMRRLSLAGTAALLVWLTPTIAWAHTAGLDRRRYPRFGGGSLLGTCCCLVVVLIVVAIILIVQKTRRRPPQG
jgi:hypothetical protein